MFGKHTLWLFNIAMENCPFIDDFPIKTSIYKGFSMAMLNNQIVRACVQLGMMKPNRQKTLFFVWMQGTHPVFTCFYQVIPSISTAFAVRVVTCCYMLLLGLLFDSGWLRTAFKVKHLWTSLAEIGKVDGVSPVSPVSSYSPFFGRLAWGFSMVYNLIFTESPPETGRLQYLAKFAFSFWSIESPFVLVNGSLRGAK